MKIGEVLKTIRKEKTNLNQGKAADLMGITQTYLSQVESGIKKPSQEMLETMCAAYKMPVPIVIWMSFEQGDVGKGKIKAFRQLKPLVDEMIKEYFPIS